MFISLALCDDKKEKPELKISVDTKEKKILENNLLENNYLQYVDILKQLLNKNRDLLLTLRFLNLHERYYDMVNIFHSKIVENSNNKFSYLASMDETSIINILKLSINDYELTNIKFDKLENTELGQTYSINFEFGFFDSLQKNTLNILENIYNTYTKNCDSNNAYIDYGNWEDYCKKNIKKISFNNEVTYKLPILNKYIAKEKPFDFFNSDFVDEDVKSYFKEVHDKYKSEDNLLNQPKLEILYEEQISNEEDLLYTFLNLIFVNNHIFKIKKCIKCNKFFIVINTGTATCNRTTSNGKTCTEIRSNASRNKYKVDIVHEYEKRIKDLYKSETKKSQLDKFTSEYREKRRRLSGNKYLYWLISHYARPNTYSRHKKIIDEYIENNPNFEKEFKKHYNF